MTRALRILGVVAIVAMLSGCDVITGPSSDPDITVEGTITLEGVPVSGAQVELHGRQPRCSPFSDEACGEDYFIDRLAVFFTNSNGQYRVAFVIRYGCEDLSLFIVFPPLALPERIHLPDCGSFTRNVALTRTGQ